MIQLKKLVKHLDSFLKIKEIPDKSNNGLQIEGEGVIKKVGIAVDINGIVIKECIKRKIDFLIVHHGLFWGTPLLLTGANKRRIKMMIDNNISLYAAHLPLDKHEKIGNNICLAKMLKLVNLKRFGDYNGILLGYYGNLIKSMKIDRFASLLEKMFIHDVFVIRSRETVKKIGVISGRGSSMFHECIDLGIDTFITGEQTHDIYAEAVDNDINVIFAGHYETETVGVKALGEYIRNKYKDLKTEFIYSPTGL